ncbi:MAG TPA: hypothetical protein VKT77_23380, partial [Chthonomonadaceae bacterium]|nr:hypothetical protein [Chthonomonadaceae bacterium]
MLPRIFIVSILTTMLLSPHRGARAQDDVPETKEAFVSAITAATFIDLIQRRTLAELAAHDSEFAYAVFREAWPRIKDANVRRQLLASFADGGGGYDQPGYRPNARLLDMLSLALDQPLPRDPNGRAPQDPTRAYVLDTARGIAFRDFAAPEEFLTWRAAEGDKPAATIVQEEARRTVRELETGSVDQQLKALALLGKLQYFNGSSTRTVNGVTTREHMASGLMGARRRALTEARLPELLGRLLKTDHPAEVRQASVRVLARFQPADGLLRAMEPDMRRELPILLDHPEKTPAGRAIYPANALELLGAYTSDWDSDWASELIVRLLSESAATGSTDYTLQSALMYCNNPRVIPALIGLMDQTDRSRGAYNPYDNVLRRLAGGYQRDLQREFSSSGGSGEHDSLWWRLWWYENKKRFPPDVQKIPIPVFHKSGAAPMPTVPARRRVERIFVMEDPNRSYWAIAPKREPDAPLTAKERAAIAGSGPGKLAAAKPERAGLIVLLPDDDAADGAGLERWLALSDALNGRCYLAVVIRPRWSDDPSASRWRTAKDLGEPPHASFGVEELVEQIVRQMQSNAAIEPSRTYLAAEGSAGIAGYACALQKATAI